MTEEDKMIMATRLEERILEVQKLTNTQMDMMIPNQKLNQKDAEIRNLN